MSQETTYTCDRCGASGSRGTGAGDISLWKVGIAVSRFESTPVVDREQVQDWCHKCAADAGLFDHNWKEKEAAEAEGVALPEPPTLEEIIMDLIRQEIDA